MPDVFLSYSREDQPTARKFAEALKREGFNVWWDQALDAGESFDKVTEQALKDAKAVVVLWSKHSVDSRWVRSEATQADRYGTLVPVTIEPCNRPIMFELTHTADLSGWTGDIGDSRWRAFVEGLGRTVGKSASPVAAPAASVAVAPRPRAHRVIGWAAGAVVVVLATALFWQFHNRDTKSPATATGSPVATSPAVPTSVAVLPFRDMSQNRDQEYFADGVTEEILNTLAGLKDLKVTARTSAFAFKGKDVDLRTVGKTLGVAHILEGSIRKDGDTLRITAQLIDAASDAHLWSRTYDRPLKDIFKVQEEIARSVAESLQVSLGVGFGNQPGMTRDVDAYDAALAAQALVLKQNAESQRRAIGLLEQAIARDPSYGGAWAMLSYVYGDMPGLVPEETQVWLQKAGTALDNARRLAPGSPFIHLLLARRSISQSRWSEAAGHFENWAAEAAKLGEPVPLDKGIFLLMVGRARDALAQLEEWRARDPLNPQVSFDLGVAYFEVGNFPAAKAEFERGAALDASWQYLFQLVAVGNAMAAGDRAEVRRLQTQIASASIPRREIQVQLVSLLDRPSDAVVYLRKQVQDPSTPPAELGGFAQWLAYFGDAKSAFEAHRLALERGGVNTAIFSTWYPVMREVRRLPEFKQLVHDAGLVDYWREYGWGDFCKLVGDADFECS